MVCTSSVESEPLDFNAIIEPSWQVAFASYQERLHGTRGIPPICETNHSDLRPDSPMTHTPQFCCNFLTQYSIQISPTMRNSSILRCPGKHSYSIQLHHLQFKWLGYGEHCGKEITQPALQKAPACTSPLRRLYNSHQRPEHIGNT